MRVVVKRRREKRGRRVEEEISSGCQWKSVSILIR